MTETSLIDYMYIFLFLVVGFIGGFAPFIVNWFIRPKRTHLEKSLNTYECGIFLAFDVDILYLFPVAAYFDKVSGARGVIEIFIFIGILSLAIVYAWAKGVFTWKRKRTVR